MSGYELAGLQRLINDERALIWSPGTGIPAYGTSEWDSRLQGTQWILFEVGFEVDAIEWEWPRLRPCAVHTWVFRPDGPDEPSYTGYLEQCSGCLEILQVVQ